MSGTEPPPAFHVIVEAARIAASQSYRTTEMAAEEPFVTLVRVAAALLQAPTAMISLIDRDHQSTKAAFGADLQRTPRSLAICSYTINDPSGAMIIPNTLADLRFRDHPLVVSSPYIRFYAGVCLIDDSGCVIGTLCVTDQKPSTVSADQLAILHGMAKAAVSALAQRRATPAAWRDSTVLAIKQPGKPPPFFVPPSYRQGSSTQGWLGVRTKHTLVPGSDQEGRLLLGVAANSPAARAKLLVDDIILTIDSHPVKRRDDIVAAISCCALGDTIRLRIWRDGKVFDHGVRLEAMPKKYRAAR